MFEQIEEALDKVAFAIKRKVALALGLAVGLRRDNWGDFPLVERADIFRRALYLLKTSSAA